MRTKLRGKSDQCQRRAGAHYGRSLYQLRALSGSLSAERKTFASDLERVKGYLAQGFKTIISIAPSYAGVLDFDQPGQVVDALLKLGFYEVRETAEGAALVTNEYKKLVRENEMPNIITTCCPSVNDLIENIIPTARSIWLLSYRRW